MSDWRLANKQGQLVWTSPAVPNGGQSLHTTMSPTLILGCTKQGDAIPVNYVKLPDVTRASMSTPNSILLERRTGANMLLVCNDGPQEAASWLECIQRVVGGGGSLAATSASAKKPPADPASPKNPPPKPADPSLTGIANALQSDLKSKPIAVPEATPAAGTSSSSSAAGGVGITRPAAASAVDLPVVAADGGRGGAGGAAGFNKPDPLSATSLRQQQSAASTMSATSASMLNASGTNASAPTSPGGASSPIPADLASGSKQPASQSTVHPSLTSAQQQQQAQQKSIVAANGSSSSNFPTTPTNSSSGGGAMMMGSGLARPQQQQQQPSGMMTTPNSTTNNNTPSGAGGTGPGGRFRPEDSAPHPLAQTKLEKVQNEIVTPDPAAGQSTIRPVVAPPLGSSLSSGRPGMLSSGVAAAGNGNNSGAWSAMNQSGPADMAMNQSGGSLPQRGGGSGAADTLPDGSLMAAARRRGMLVDLPATQNVNRAIAPNASAVWKEWRDPNGVLYVMHEGTGTLQRLMPGDDKFQEYHTDEEQERLESQPGGGGDYHSPHHMEGDATLDMGNMTVSNLQHYGAAGAAQSGIPFPPVPAGNLMREMVVPVPRGQFSPTRRVQVEPLAVPRVNDSRYVGKRVHRFTLSGAEDPRVSVVEHQVQSLDTEGVKWDPRSGNVIARDAQQQSTIGDVTLRRQWEHVKAILQQGRYFKKHAFRKANSSAFRYVFLSADTAWICCVPTSDVMVKVLEDGTMAVGPESQQYFPADSKALGLNAVEAVVLAVEEDSLRYRQGEMDLDSTFCIITRTHMLILECNSPKEARFFCDAWNFFMFYSKPERPPQVPQMKAPVTFGTRGGIRW